MHQPAAKAVAVLLLSLFTQAVQAQDVETAVQATVERQAPLSGREEALQEIARALAEIQQATDAAQTVATAEASTSLSGAASYLLEQAMRRAADLQEYLRDNEFVRMTGFSVGLPAGVTIDLEFIATETPASETDPRN